ncbi:hypothetical protein C7U92_29995 [Bradyrhizobium sp. WBOS7]|uniref:Uncharacterized protein n=1 Tax=Bradyrhizobium betae TaxID=244734 RepID=A0AAE9SRF2_9BRAD|nr:MULTISPECIES: hypothetical protein [Bradyrhizobium]MDD1574969.1 hypothetical protein [Bradyrhizobium sp. WBOS1]UUO33389.1 hypothetical protein DCK84_01520 [Bradyrhizobium sp. WBOS01]MDD1531671.1 hypothetical protein [Bradyrhizobium sp. WBOS2]MDD1580919.1 hypothetical protein [Bradyrhizobium sp. WBOS7]MDD1604893.1 hypothetical protein [Bradyrhizobium sp. WBOS16]
MPVTFKDILQAFEFADVSGGMGECHTFVCRQTGKIYYQFDDDSLQDLEEDELPDDIEDEAKYLRIPNSRDFDLGKPLVIAFVRELLPDDLDEVRYFFSKRGAYQKFKALLSRRRAIGAWHDYRNKATERALRDWCEVHSIEIVD